MREKTRAVGIALIVPFAYWLIQLVVTVIGSLQYGMSWAAANDINDQTAWQQAISDYMGANGIYFMLAAALLGLAMAFLIIRREPAAAKAGLLNPPDGPSAVMLVLCGLSLNVLIGFILSLMSFPDNIVQDYEDLVSTLNSGGPLAQFAITCLVIPIAEEALFRGVCFRALRRAFPARTALVMQALLFSVFHGNLLQMTGVFPIALVLGLVLEWSGSLVAPILLHVAFNSSNALLVLLPEDSPYTVVLSLLLILLSAAASVFSIRGLYKRRRETNEQMTIDS